MTWFVPAVVRKHAAWALSLATLLLAPWTAHAHSPPLGMRLLFDSTGDSSNTPWVIANRGLVQPKPGGHWALRCNEAYGTTPLVEPTVLMAGGNQLLLANLARVLRSEDGGCTFLDASPVDGKTLTASLATADALWVATGNAELGNALYRSDDLGESWQTLFEAEAGQWFTALRRAPSNANRLYATQTLANYQQETLGYGIAVSDDGGSHWTTFETPEPRALVAVHPENPDILFAQTQRKDTAEYALFRSADAGETFGQVAVSPTAFTSLTLAPSGTELWLGAGLGGGLLTSSDEGASFQPIADTDIAAVHSLQRHGGRLWMCANRLPNQEGCWSQPETGGPWELLLTFDEVDEALACEDAAAAALCEDAWNDWAYELLGTPFPEAGTPAPADAGADGGPPAPRPRDGGTTPLLDGGGSEPPPSGDTGVGGGCQATGTRRGNGNWLALFGLLLGILLRGRRHRIPSQSSPAAQP